MKNNYPKKLVRLFAIIIFSLLQESTMAQLNYSFQSAAETYQPLIGGTTLITATDSLNNTTSLNSYVSTLPIGVIPFVFYYNGSGYTNCTVNSNGYLTFGTSAATNVNPISSTANYAGALAAFGRDLIGNYRISNSGDPDTIASIRYGTTGVSPNRKFVVEYNNFRPTSTVGQGTGPNFSFQIRLTEGTNNIEYIYGNFVGSPWPSGGAQVGLRGQNNTVFFNRAVASGQPWVNSTQGPINNSFCLYTAATLPVSGTVYRFLAPCPTPTSLSLVDALPTSVKLRWNSATGPGGYPGSSYTVQWGPAGFALGTGTTVVTTDTFLLLTGLTTGANYDYYVQRNCTPTGNGLSTYAGPKNFTTGGPTEDCDNAVLVPVAANLSACLPTLVTSGVSQNGPNSLCSDALGGNLPNDDRWYKFVAPGNGKRIVITTTAGTNGDWVMEVWNSCPGTGGFAFKCTDDITGGMPADTICQDEYTPGQTYYVRLWTYSQTATGNMTFCVYEDAPCPIAPSYDICDTPAVFPISGVLSCPGNELIFSTLFATPSGVGGSNGAQPTCDGSPALNDIFLKFNSGATGTFTLTFNAITATDLRAQLLFSCSEFEIQCFNPASGTHTITGLNPSAPYILRVWSANGQGGTFSVCAQDACDDATALLSGSSTICSTGVAQLRVDLTGLPPWNVTYTNGVSNFNFSTSTTPHFINVSPTITTFYNLVSVSSPLCNGTVDGVGSVNVVPPPTVTLAPFTSSVCSNQIITLTGGSPVGGAYSGTGVSGNQFNGATAGVGTHTITYTYGIGSGCSRSASRPITVIPGPTITSFSPSVAPVGSTVTITGSGLLNVTTVRFNLTNAVSFTIVNATTITAIVPVGATTGFITLINSNTCSVQSTTTFGVGNPPGAVLNIKAYVEGYYIGGGLMNAVVNPGVLPTKADTFHLELRNPISPYGLVATRTELANTNGTFSVSFTGSFVGNSYYLVLKGRNIIETWSKNPVLLQSGSNTFDFSVPGAAMLRPNLNGSGPSNNTTPSQSAPLDKPEHPE
ncbi:MAG: fibronectin type III domain-containing protein [Bacteroidetes bacterium]|nr:fibronectin type III domain-containing protein [Bacteroidota bacterium]